MQWPIVPDSLVMQWLTRLPCHSGHGLYSRTPDSGCSCPRCAACSCSWSCCRCPCLFLSCACDEISFFLRLGLSSTHGSCEKGVLLLVVLFVNKINLFKVVHSCYLAQVSSHKQSPLIRTPITHDAEWVTRCFTREMLPLWANSKNWYYWRSLPLLCSCISRWHKHIDHIERAEPASQGSYIMLLESLFCTNGGVLISRALWNYCMWRGPLYCL
jgi:hypothetical protein